MLHRREVVFAVAGLAASSVLPRKAIAQKQPVTVPPDKLVLGTDEVKQLLLLMDTDKNGKISKQEWLDFMSAEFDRLDTDKSGELDIREIAKSKVRASHFADAGK